MMAHIMERYFTNTTGVEITDRMCEGALKAIIKEAAVVMEHPDDYEARANLMWCGTIAHNGICGVGRQEDWGFAFHGARDKCRLQCGAWCRFGGCFPGLLTSWPSITRESMPVCRAGMGRCPDDQPLRYRFGRNLPTESLFQRHRYAGQFYPVGHRKSRYSITCRETASQQGRKGGCILSPFAR